MWRDEVTFEVHGDEARRVGDMSARCLSFTKQDVALDVARRHLAVVR